MRARTILTFLIPLLAAAALFAGCNQNGTGIFYTLNTEVKQTGGDFPMANQVVEWNNDIYIRTGNSARRLDGDSWTVVKSQNVDSIATNGTNLYAMIAEKLSSNSDNAYIQSYDGSGANWTTHPTFDYTDDSYMLTMDDSAGPASDEFMFIHNRSSYEVDHIDSSFSSVTTGNTLPNSGEYPIDGAIMNPGTETYYLIGKYTDSNDNIVTTLYDTTDFSAWGTSISGYQGNLRSITAEDIGGTDYIFFTTYDPDSASSKLYAYDDASTFYTIDNTSIIEDDGTQVSDAPDSLRVVYLNGGVTPYLIVGAADGYYEVNVSGSASGWTLKRPTPATADIASDSSLGAKYPDLAVSYVFSVYPDPTDTDVFYLGVGKESGNILGGLWKRKADGSFQKQ